MTKVAAWKRQPPVRALHTPVFDVHRFRATSPRTRRDGDYYVVNCPDWVNIVATTSDERIVMIRQYRHGLDDITLEIPGGMVDSDDREPADAAIRELREETGYHATHCVPVGCVAPNPALQSNRCYTFFAPEVQKRSAQALDGGEDIEVVLMSLTEVNKALASGIICHALVVSALLMYQKFQPV